MVVPIINDEVLELTEVFLGRIAVVGGQPGVQVGQDTAAVTITNDDSESHHVVSAERNVVTQGAGLVACWKKGISCHHWKKGITLLSVHYVFPSFISCVGRIC